MKKSVIPALVAALAIFPLSARTEVPPHAFFNNVKDGATVASPFHVIFGVEGIRLAPAGSSIPGSGHFYLLVDADASALNPAAAIPSDANHIDYGKAEPEADVKLSPGKHTLQLVMGNGQHMPFDPPIVSPKITVTVSAPLVKPAPALPAAAVPKTAPLPAAAVPAVVPAAATGASSKP